MKQSTDRVGDEVARIATTLLADSESMSATMAEQMRANVPVYRTDVVTADELQATCFDNLHFVFGAMGRSTPADSPESRENGRQRARVGIPLTDVMAAYRIGARFMWDRLSSAAARCADRGRHSGCSRNVARARHIHPGNGDGLSGRDRLPGRDQRERARRADPGGSGRRCSRGEPLGCSAHAKAPSDRVLRGGCRVRLGCWEGSPW